MPRRKLSEHKSKILISKALDVQYVGWSVDSVPLPSDITAGSYVVKVDQAVKGRFKKGLVLLDVKKPKLAAAISSLSDKGYNQFLIEPQRVYESKQERYLLIGRDRRGSYLSYSALGGVDIESHVDSVETTLLDEKTDWVVLAEMTGIIERHLRALFTLFVDNYFVFLEINPYVSHAGDFYILDAAIEVDDAGMYFTQAWSEDDIRTVKVGSATHEEDAVRLLDASSPASFNLSVLNPDGAIFLLLSGGGASVVIADEVYNQGYGKELANYGEYSGNPNSHEAYIYTAEVMKLLLTSKAKRKVVFIGGAVANFTDIANTFAGVIKAIEEYSTQLARQKIKIYVRRGGPRQELGLAKMHHALEQYGLLGGVYDPSTTITDALGAALKGLKK